MQKTMISKPRPPTRCQPRLWGQDRPPGPTMALCGLHNMQPVVAFRWFFLSWGGPKGAQVDPAQSMWADRPHWAPCRRSARRARTLAFTHHLLDTVNWLAAKRMMLQLHVRRFANVIKKTCICEPS